MRLYENGRETQDLSFKTGALGQMRLENTSRKAHFKPRGYPFDVVHNEGTPVTTLAFDTLKFAQTLRDKAKFTQEQSEGLAFAISDATSDQLATKADLKDLRIELKFDMREMEMRLDTKIETLCSDVLKWIVGSIGFQTLVILGAVITLARFTGHN